MPIKTSATPVRPAQGYWTIQVVNSDRALLGRRYLCHAIDDRQARSIATRLSGSSRGTAGFDYQRIDDPRGGPVLALGESRLISDAAEWKTFGRPSAPSAAR